jgi:hypothetical protein
MLGYCPKCESVLKNTSAGPKCKRCDDISQIPKNGINKSKIGILSNDEFPFEKNQRYVQKDIRKTLNCHRQYGISYNKEYNFFVLIRNAHKHIPNQDNVYHDRYDPDSGLYYYIGMGTTGHQKLTGNNLALLKSKENNQKVHLFWEKINGSDHYYIGEVQIEDVKSESQKGKGKEDRDVIVYTLKVV